MKTINGKAANIKKTNRALSDDPMNVARRLLYKKEAAYRTKVLTRNKMHRQGERKVRTGVSDYSARIRARAANIPELSRFGEDRRLVMAKGKPGAPVRCLAYAELAGALDRNVDTVARWHSKKFILLPDLSVFSRQGRPFQAYSVKRASVILKAIAEVVTCEQGHIREHHREQLCKLQGVRSL